MKSPFSRFFGGSDKQGQDPVVEATQTNNEGVVQVAIEKIVPNRYQPRTVFDDAKI